MKVLMFAPGQEAIRAVLERHESGSFVLSPFEGELERYNVVGELSEDAFWTSFGLADLPDVKSIESDEYQDKIKQALKAIEVNGLDKVVLSRTAMESSEGLHPKRSFENLIAAYPECTVFALVHPEYGSWMGASPEILLAEEGKGFKSMSLAGTRLKGGQLWGAKEVEEQKWVTKEIQRTFKALGGTVKRTAVETLEAGPVEHLMNWVSSEDTPAEAIELLKQLHPTPAVCGTPRTVAKDLIHELEGYQRELYTGFLAVLKPQVHAAVVLRAMRWGRDRVQFFAGGGITKDSEPKSEWMETNHKVSALKDALS